MSNLVKEKAKKRKAVIKTAIAFQVDSLSGYRTLISGIMGKISKATKMGEDDLEFDEIIQDIVSEKESALNNAGAEAQLRVILGEMGIEAGVDHLNDIYEDDGFKISDAELKRLLTPK